jgi:predicted PolB exonuclease-like 3'-5' exonuclease
MNIFVFDIETVPDVESGRKLMGLNDLDNHDVANIIFQQHRQETGGSDFLRRYLPGIPVFRVDQGASYPATVRCRTGTLANNATV